MNKLKALQNHEDSCQLSYSWSYCAKLLHIVCRTVLTYLSTLIATIRLHSLTGCLNLPNSTDQGYFIMGDVPDVNTTAGTLPSIEKQQCRGNIIQSQSMAGLLMMDLVIKCMVPKSILAHHQVAQRFEGESLGKS